MRFPEEHFFLEGSKAWPDCPSGKRNIYIDDEHGALVEWYWQGKTRSTRRKICPTATLSNTDLSRAVLGSSPGLRSEKRATNFLNHGTTSVIVKLCSCKTWRQCLLLITCSPGGSRTSGPSDWGDY